MFLPFVLVVGLVFGFPALPEYAIDPAIEQIHDAKVFHDNSLRLMDGSVYLRVSGCHMQPRKRAFAIPRKQSSRMALFPSKYRLCKENKRV